VARDELFRRLRADEVLILDVRPAAEYAAGHIPGAVSMPHDELAARLSELPAGADIVAYCRGRYCVYAPDAVRLLRASGFAARPLAGGLPEWRLAGLPVTTGSNPIGKLGGRRHFPECADWHRAQARPEGEGFLPGVQHKSCDEIITQALCQVVQAAEVMMPVQPLSLRN
jgi:rhodanese-related sulfurtransferase